LVILRDRDLGKGEKTIGGFFNFFFFLFFEVIFFDGLSDEKPEFLLLSIIFFEEYF